MLPGENLTAKQDHTTVQFGFEVDSRDMIKKFTPDSDSNFNGTTNSRISVVLIIWNLMGHERIFGNSSFMAHLG